MQYVPDLRHLCVETMCGPNFFPDWSHYPSNPPSITSPTVTSIAIGTSPHLVDSCQSRTLAKLGPVRTLSALLRSIVGSRTIQAHRQQRQNNCRWGSRDGEDC